MFDLFSFGSSLLVTLFAFSVSFLCMSYDKKERSGRRKPAAYFLVYFSTSHILLLDTVTGWHCIASYYSISQSGHCLMVITLGRRFGLLGMRELGAMIDAVMDDDVMGNDYARFAVFSG